MNVTAGLIGPNRYEDKAAELGVFERLPDCYELLRRIISSHDVRVTQALLLGCCGLCWSWHDMKMRTKTV